MKKMEAMSGGQLVIGTPAPLVLHTHVPLAFSYMLGQLSEQTI